MWTCWCPSVSALRDVDHAAGRVDYPRHFVLLACAALLLAVTGRWRQSLGAGVSFALYGAVHSTTVVLTLRDAQTLARKLLFIAVAAACSWLTVMLGAHGIRYLGMLPATVGPALLLCVCSGTGAASYALLIRGFWIPRLPLRALPGITLACMSSMLAIFKSGVFLKTGGSLWFAAGWWFALSASLWFYDGRGPSNSRPREISR